MINFDSMLLAPCMQTFGEPVVYTTAGYKPLTIQAVFFRSSMQLLPMGGSGGQEPYLLGASGDLTTREPMLGVQLSQFALAERSIDAVQQPNFGITQPTFGLYPTPPPPTGDDLFVVSDIPSGPASMQAPTQGDTAYIVSLDLLYQVKEVLPDGVGHARLTLTLLASG